MEFIKSPYMLAVGYVLALIGLVYTVVGLYCNVTSISYFGAGASLLSLLCSILVFFRLEEW